MARLINFWIMRSCGYECSHCGSLSDEPIELCPCCDSDMEEYDEEE